MKLAKGTIQVVSEELRRRIVQEIESGSIGQTEASRVYGINRTAIGKWLKSYGKLSHHRQIVEVVMKDEKEKIEELQRALADAHLKLRIYEKVIDLASEDVGMDLKKNFSTKALEQLKGKAEKSKSSVK